MGALRNHFMNLYPYTDFHELNADWMIKMLMKMVDEVENFVAQNAIKYADPIQWNITKQYEKNTIVVDPITGTAYLSNHPVPLGIALSNTHYWSVVFDLGRFVTLASQNFANTYESVTTTTATQPTDEGNWVVWDSTLYIAKNDIHVGDAYVVDGNIEKKTVEDFFNALKSSLASEAQTRADEDARIELSLTDLITSRVNTEAQARADEDSRIELSLTDLITSKVGIEAQTRADEDARIELSLSDLITSKVGIEAQTRADEDTRIYNELNNKIVKGSMYVNLAAYNADPTGVEDSITAFENAIADVPIHGTLFIPNGTYLLSRALVIEKPITILGDYTGWDCGVDQTYITRDEALQTLIVSSVNNTSEGAIVIKQNGVQIRNLAIKCDGVGATHGIYIPDTEDYTTYGGPIRNVIIDNVALWLARSLRGGTFNSGIMSQAILICSSITHVWTYNFACGIRLNNGGDAVNISNCWVIECCALGYYLKDVNYSNLDSCACDCSLAENRCAYGYYLDNCKSISFNGCAAEQMNINAFYITNASFAVLNGCYSYLPNVSGNANGGLVDISQSSQVTLNGCGVAPKDVNTNCILASHDAAVFNILSSYYSYIRIGGNTVAANNATYIKNTQQ